jgi:hypothetical protein
MSNEWGYANSEGIKIKGSRNTSLRREKEDTIDKAYRERGGTKTIKAKTTFLGLRLP